MKIGDIWRASKSAVSEFVKDDALTLAGALAFYTTLSLAPLLIIGVLIVGLVYRGDAQEQAVQRASETIGSQGAEIVRTVLQNASQTRRSIVAAIIGFGMFLFSASGVLGQLQYSLNLIWGVRARPDVPWWDWFRRRFWALVMMLVIGAIFVASIAASTALLAVENQLRDQLELPSVWRWLNGVVPLLVYVALFAMIYKILPDVEMSWRDVWWGAFITAILFSIGKWLIGWYIARGTISSVYGAAGSLVALLTWLYYSAVIFFFGAELTQAYAKARGADIRPGKYAVWRRREEMPREGK